MTHGALSLVLLLGSVNAACLHAPPPPVTVARPAPDRWQALRDQLGGCVALGLFERAMCEQRARLQHCDGYWGHVGLCPAGRTEFGQ